MPTRSCSCGNTYPGHLSVCPDCHRAYQPPSPPPRYVSPPPPPPPGKDFNTRLNEWLNGFGPPPVELTLEQRAKYMKKQGGMRAHMAEQLEKFLGDDD